MQAPREDLSALGIEAERMDDKNTFGQLAMAHVDGGLASAQAAADFEGGAAEARFVEGDFEDGQAFAVAALEDRAARGDFVQTAGDRFEVGAEPGELSVV